METLATVYPAMLEALQMFDVPFRGLYRATLTVIAPPVTF